MDLRHGARAAFTLNDPAAKVAAVQALWQQRADLGLAPEAQLEAPAQPGRPSQPVLVLPKDVPRRSPYTAVGHAALIHSIAHIEFNAINLALDAAWRFAGMPAAYYSDWLRVAFEESQHFSLLSDHLATLGHAYGDFPAHDGLWTMAENTRCDVVARMALVPRTLEARGLDATPLIQAKLRKVGSPAALQAVAILDTILREEVGHVAIGNHWYRWLCQREGLDSTVFHTEAARRHGGPSLKPPFNLAARKLAGFSQQELDALPTIAA
ncbi:MAG: ferritin-like domain-containing protein [Rhodoferax sp.]|nr:ferritin-like domain-containing protein [Rhodoferax sp.]